MNGGAPLARLCLPWVPGRGAGLGNELVPWARAWLIAQAVGARALDPAFGLNPRRYDRHFGASRSDWLLQRGLQRVLPVLDFDEAEYLQGGGGDVAQSFAAFAQRHGLDRRHRWLVRTEGLWGGFHHIARARPWVRARLAASRWAAANLGELGARLHPDRLSVAMHVRLGDFAPPRSMADYRNRFNVSLPLEWFVDAGRQLQAAFGSHIEFLVFSDGSAEQLRPLTDTLNTVPTGVRHPADVSDLLAMSQADLLLCSVSSYSAWAAFLSDQPYLWFAPQLEPLADGWGAAWGHEARQQADDSPTRAALRQRGAERPDLGGGRGHALWPGTPLPDALLETLALRLRDRSRATDLLRYGVVPLCHHAFTQRGEHR